MSVEIHGEAKARNHRPTRLYILWTNMRSRCLIKNKPGHKDYKYYKHVTCCPEWESYVEFKKWALTNGYAENLSLDRLNNALGYSPTNCRWATHSQQMKNRTWTPQRKSQMLAAQQKRWRDRAI